ncbi:MAG TPA: carboxypeptidase regulatory-like domain-containing protein, partial [Thermoanaerobaculia bacterium]|nr:carboxypeptidase regulatory-like domain-containing protein [Thermoanaerobaculia bacterium]
MRYDFVFLKRAFTLAILLLGLAFPVLAQLQTGSLLGTAVGPDGQPLPGVTVTLSGGGAPQIQTTDEQGRFRFPGLPPGAYTVDGQLGDLLGRREEIAVNVGRTAEVELRMIIPEVINVTAEKGAPLLDFRDPGKKTTVTLSELESIPTARDPWAVLQTTPGVLTDRVNVGGNESGQQAQYVGPGSAGDQAVWSLDGMVVTDMSAVGSSPGYYDFDAFEEMQVTTGGSDASIATGGVVLNMVTRRGTNEWRGSGRYLVMNDGTQSGLEFDQADLAQAGPWNNNRGQSSFKQGNRIDKV